MTVRAFFRQWWPPALRRALYSWQQTADDQEWELAALRRVRDSAQVVLGSHSASATRGHTRDVVGLAESLRRYREMAYGTPRRSVPRLSGRDGKEQT